MFVFFLSFFFVTLRYADGTHARDFSSERQWR